MTDFEKKLDCVLGSVKHLLMKKNKSYGNTATNPINVFSKLEAREALYCRIDDKLARIKAQETYEREDTIEDLIGYLVYLKTLDVSVEREGKIDCAEYKGGDILPPLRDSWESLKEEIEKYAEKDTLEEPPQEKSIQKEILEEWLKLSSQEGVIFAKHPDNRWG